MEWYSQNLEKNLEDLEMEVETLNAMINKLLRRVTKENDKGLQTLPEVKEWISMAEENESKASSLLDKSISECQDLSGWTLHYNEMVCTTLKEVKALRSTGVFKELVERAPLSRVRKMLPLQPIVSREMLLEKVWKCFAENTCRTLGLYGVAGVGKTALLTQIKKKFIEDGDASSLVLFVVVESEEETEGIQDEIGKRLGLYVRPKDKNEKAFEILQILNVKRFVLLLDGIQREVDLEEIGVPLPSRENGCKIVFTTRSQEACGSKWVDAVEEVKCLSQEEAWDIFQDIVGETTLKSHPVIPQLARIVARKCGGLPIALSLIGKTMSRKRTVREWHHAIHVLVSSTAESTSTKYEIFPVLKFSYDSLPGENIKLCFLYCALFPKDDDISKQDLVDCWIGEGIIEDEDKEIAEIHGYEMMDDLVSMRLLMEDESGYLVKMHGMVREMALWIASDFGRQKENFVVVGGKRIHQMPEVNDWRIVTRLSVTCTRIENISGFPDCSELKTLFLQGNSNLKWISGDFFRWMTSLVVLNLSSNREFAELPEEVSSLVSLQFLNLSFTSIKRLPLGLKELKRLIHLDLDYTTLLQEIDVLGSLLNLKVLRLFQSVPMDLSLMEDIQLLKSLKELSLTVREADVLKRLPSIHQLSSCIRHLHLTGITITNGGILLLNSMLSLRELNIGMCDIPEITISCRSTIQRERLHFGNIEKIPLLQNLHTVTLSWCTGLRDLTWLLLAPNLGDLRVHDCQQIERIIDKEKATADMSEQPFQNLTRLSLDSLPQLESIYWTPLPFPVLEYLYIRGCPKLTRLPFNSDSAKGNQVRSDLDQEWIKGVEWEDEATKELFSGFDDRDFQKIAEDQKMDGLASESHPVENIFMVESSSGKSTNRITGEKVFQSTTHATMEHPPTNRVLTTDGMISNMTDTPEEYSHNLETNPEDLNELLRRVSKEKDKGLQTLPKVEKWISVAEESESKASSFLGESSSEYQDLSTYDDGSKISEGVFKELAERPPVSYVKKMHPLQPIVSREMLLEKLWKCFAENKCWTLGLYGMPGVGKTTLLTQIKKKFIEDGDASSLVLFVVVESEEEIEGIQDEIGKRLGLLMGRKDQKEKAFEISEILNVKRFVLLLDGIQREVDLEEIGVPLPSRENGCKIVFTTRSQEACESKWIDAVEEVKCLSQEEAWDIFQEIVGETTLKSHPDIPQLARIVARKCGGLPIALSFIGETMSRKRTVQEWHHAVHVLVSSSAAEFSGMEAELLPILKFTYDNLPGEIIRSCFLYCAIFPKDNDMSKQDLVDCWIGEGIIEEEDREMAEIQGYEMMGDLVRMRLLMDNESGYGVKMYGMVREMALWIASDFGWQKENFVVVGGQRIHQMPEVNDWRIVRRMSVTCTQIENISVSPECSKLTTLFLQGNSNLKWISSDFFRWMTSLVVLNLSSNREFAELPEEVSSLVSLQFLNLSFTSIKRLPIGLKELKRLIHLDLDYTALLRDIDVIGSLLNLKVLRLFQSVPIDLSLMEDIQLLKSLKELSLTVREADVLKRLLSIHQLSSCIRRLHLSWITDGGILLLNSMLSLRELNIGMCDIPEITISCRSTIQRETLHLGNIEKILLLQNIRTVTLSWCTGLRDLTWLLLAPNLGDLRIHDCQQIELIINKEKAVAAVMSEQPFQNLTKLSLDGLPQLESIYWTPLPFPVLEYLYIRACPKLTRLPFNSDSSKGNQVRSFLDQEWIKGAEWEDEATKQHFSGFDDRDFPIMDEDQMMDGLASESHQIENIVLGETSESGENTTANNITGEVFQSTTHATMEHTQTDRRMISNMIDTPGGYGITGAIAGGVATGSALPFAAPTTAFAKFAWWRRRKPQNIVFDVPEVHLRQLTRFPLRELQVASGGFSNKNILGGGRFGKVYKGRLPDGSLVAVKRLKGKLTPHVELQFQTEVKMACIAVHRKILRLRGFCMTRTERLLVYPYMANGSVASCLRERPPSHPPLDWPTRKRIALGSARGLSYLHDHCDPKIIHRDVKAGNILLDEKFEPVVGDFGLAKLMDHKDTHVTTLVRGTIGHIAPEYLSTGKCSEKTDVFGYGIMLLELITGQRVFDLARLANDDDVMLLDWVKGLLKEKKVEMLVDSDLQTNYEERELEQVIQVALLCTQQSPMERPKMSDVVRMLEADVPAERWNESPNPHSDRIIESPNPHSDRIFDSTYSSQTDDDELPSPR